MDETDYFQKRDKYKEKIVDDEWNSLKKIKNKQGKTIKSKPENPSKKPDKNKNQ